jgi:ribulose 1,5-bisphosphate carboxylase large subunit-like protein/DNA-binding HxlR family transcriptional regulator
MQFAKDSQLPIRFRELAERLRKYKTKGIETHLRVYLSIEDIERLGVKFFASMLKVLHNENSWKILREIKEHGKVSSNVNNLKFNLIRLYEHGLITSIERENNSLTEFGERVLASTMNFSPYLKEAGRTEQNIVLLQLLISRGKKSFPELEEETGLNPFSLHRSLKNLVELGLVLKTEDGKYKVSDEVSLASLREFCEEIIKRYKKMGLYFQFGELRAENIVGESILSSTPSQLEYFALEDVVNDHLIVMYSYQSAISKDELVEQIIDEQTQGREGMCKPIKYEQLGKIKIGYKIDSLASLQHFLNLLCLHSITAFDKLLVEDIEIPKSFWNIFPDLQPRYGIKGVRKRLNIWGRPLLHVIVPPNLKKNVTANFVQNLIEAGVDAFGDHHFIGLRLAEFQDRVQEITAVIEKSLQRSSNKVLYYFYIDGEDFLEKIDIVKATEFKYVGLGLSPLSLGIPTTIYVRKKYEFPLHLHLTLHGIYTRMGQSYYSLKEGFKAGHGVGIYVILKLFALCGGDEINVNHYSLYSVDPREVEVHCRLLKSFNVFPALVGGIDLFNLKETVQNYGKDIIIKVSGRKFMNLKQEQIEEYVGVYEKIIRGEEVNDEIINKWREWEISISKVKR